MKPYFSWGILLIVILFLIVVFISQRQPPASALIGGMRVNASLDEIFTLLIKPGILDIVAILKSNRQVVWGSYQELALTDDYYNIHEYILILATPSRLESENLDEYGATMDIKFTRVFKRDALIGLTDVRGELLHEMRFKLYHGLYVVCAALLVISIILYLYFSRRKNPS
jgi:hypothetical protein